MRGGDGDGLEPRGGEEMMDHNDQGGGNDERDGRDGQT